MDANIVVTQVSSAATVVYLIQRLKSATWFPWLQKEGQVWAKRGLSLVAALGIHTGISYVWNPVPTPEGGHILAITIPPAAIIAIGLWHWFNQYVMQELIYQGTANRTSAGNAKP